MNIHRTKIKAGFLTLTLTVSSCVTPKSELTQTWSSETATHIDDFIDTFGRKSKSYDAKRTPIAAFDWDNTVIKGDIGDASLYWMLQQGKIKAPKDWTVFNGGLSRSAVKLLQSSCSSKSSFLPTASQPACADAILAIYSEEEINGSSSWASPGNSDLVKPGYSFAAQLFHGYSSKEVRAFVASALKAQLEQPIGTKQKVGTREVDGYIRYYQPMRDLILRLKESGFDVWIISASLQEAVEVAAEGVGIAADHVIGIRPTFTKTMKMTGRFLGCGGFPDNTTDIITYRQGKRCWLNKVVFHVSDPKQQLLRPSPIAFAAGDSDTDAFFVKDATGLRLAIDRNKKELMCNAWANADGKWIISPMFIAPNVRRKEPYACAAFGIPDQVEP